MKRIYSFLIVAVLLMINSFWILKYSKTKLQLQQEIINSRKIIIADNVKINNLENLIEHSYIRKFEKNILDNYNCKEKELIVLFINEGQCSSCLLQILNYLQTVEEKVGKEKLMILINCKNQSKYLIYKDMVSHYFDNIIQCDLPKMPKIILNHPTVFIINKESEVNYLFIPDLFPEFKDNYFLKLLPEYFI